LDASRSLIDPLAKSLAEYEDRSTLLFTGHSAGAATASLLYAHVLSEETSPLITVANGFTNIHCILFGCPPVSIHPLQHHRREDDRSSRSHFLSFLNDGDPIIKADGVYIEKRLRGPRSTSSDACSLAGDWKGKQMVPVTGLATKRSNRLFVHSGSTFLLTLDIESPSVTLIKEVDNDELDKEAAMLWRVHRISVYRTRIESCEAGRDDATTHVSCQHNSNNTRIRAGKLTPWLFMIIP
jgi:hypothetical protein